ncbi:MAG: hypothetical protein GQ570_12710 [Helicobacteraceae bacterium]|nr:hypothetical protein [Helicobacteraceae bacterium]
MRLRDIQNRINENINNLIVGKKSITKDNQNLKIDGLSQFKISFIKIEDIKIFEKDIKELRETEAIFLTNESSISLPTNEANTFVARLNSFKIKLTTFGEGISSIIPIQSENSISIKLPKINDLKELVDTSMKLDTIFNQLLVNDYETSEAKLQNFDTGSEWYEILFTSATGLWLFTKVIHAVILLQREYIKNKDMQENVRLESITNHAYETILSQMQELAKQEINNIKDEQAEEILSKVGTTKKENNDYFNRVKHVIDETSKLIDKGMVFFPSSTATQEVKDTLPDFTKDLENMLPELKKLKNEQ